MATKDVTFQVRSDEQMLFLLKLVDVNQIETKRRNLNVRHKIWNGIAEKLNRLAENGAEKDAEGWKRCYNNWRLSVGDKHKIKMQELIRNVPLNGNYMVKVTDDEESDEDEECISDVVCAGGDPIENQKLLLHRLILKHKPLLLSTADDEPLKGRLWQNIADQLNSITGGLQLSPTKWKSEADLDKYRNRPTRRTRKAKKSKTSESNCSNSSYGSHDDSTPASSSSQNRNSRKSKKISADGQHIAAVEKELENIDGVNKELTESEPKFKRIKPSPLVKNFQFSNRMVSAVEQLRNDMKSVNSSLQQTTESLNSIKDILERQCEQQDELNALLKRNSQLLKVLVEFKIGKRITPSKKNFYIHEADHK